MSVTARKVKMLRREQRLVEKKLRIEMLILLGTPPKVEPVVKCRACGLRLWIDPYGFTVYSHICQPSRTVGQEYDREKFLKKMGFETRNRV